MTTHAGNGEDGLVQRAYWLKTMISRIEFQESRTPQFDIISSYTLDHEQFCLMRVLCYSHDAESPLHLQEPC